MFIGFVATKLGPFLAHGNVLFGRASLVCSYAELANKGRGVHITKNINVGPS